ncbi:MAG TPA: patatin-like phospholipase family protein [Thermoanaerobaculia bacterium]|jgi:NTE family protein|nr:patatin-like phospholipase family protein [Thermoanaerobaculia bacterium]
MAELRMAMELVQPTEFSEPSGDLAVMLTGGGARAAYQVGLIKGLARHFPNLRFQIITGVSAGAINATFLAAHDGPLRAAADALADLWRALECRHVFRPNYAALLPFRTAWKALLPPRMTRRPHGLLNAGPLAETLRHIYETPMRNQPIAGIQRNLDRGDLKAVALIGLDYTTGQSVRWTQGRCDPVFEGPNRRSAQTEITVEHVLASAALPFVFPAVKIDSRWYGDGGIRLAAPLSSAVHLGATRILAMSTGYQRTQDEANTPVLHGYPPAAQIMGQLINAIFLDVIDEDVNRMERMNEMIEKLDSSQRNGFKPVDLFVLRPSEDLGKIAGEHEKYLPRNLKLLTRAMGTRETESPDFVSMLMFVPQYTSLLMEIGESDVASRLNELRTFLGESAGTAISAV